MKENKQTSESPAQEQPTYQTGAIHPPKNRGGLIAFLLVLVIFLCGISTALGLMNIRLFKHLSSVESKSLESPVSFSEAAVLNDPITDGPLTEFSLGFSGQSISEFWQRYYDLPQGIYVSEVEDSMIAEKFGILPGDILTRINNIPVYDAETFQTLLEKLLPGEEAEIHISRSGSEISIKIIVE